jgi:hypothetical protein
MPARLIKVTAQSLVAIAALCAVSVAPAAEHAVSLTQDPLVMRLSKDEFRIAFGINAEHGAAQGCDGVIRYRVDWKTEDGMTRSENRLVSYTVSPLASRAMTVDRQYFDTAEGQHTTEVVRVTVDSITCLKRADSRAPEVASR